MDRAALSLLLLFGLPVLALILAPHAVLLAFAGILLAVALRGAGDWIADRTGLPGWAGVAITALLLVAAILAAGFWAAGPLGEQADALLQLLPESWARLRERLGGTGWGRALLDQFSPGEVASQLAPGAATMATAAAAQLAGGLTDAIYLLFLAIFLAAAPRDYLNGLRLLVAPDLRDRCGPVLLALGKALRAWVAAQLLAMAIVGTLTYVGLWLLGVSLAGILAVVAALLGFIPILGPIIASVPALLLASGESWTMVAWVAGLYTLVQIIEGDVVTPLVQSRAIRLPPGLILLAQLLMLTLFGLFGLAMAAPLAAVLLVLVQRLYVRGYLEDRSVPTGEGP